MSISISHIVGTLNTGGIQRFILNLVGTSPLNEYKHSVICTISDQGDLRNEFTQKGIAIEFCPVIPADKGWKPYYLWKALREFAANFAFISFYLHFRKNGSDIIHSHSASSVSSQCIAAIINRKKFLWTIHGEYKYSAFEKLKLQLLSGIWGGDRFLIVADSIPAVHYTLPISKKKESIYSVIPTAVDIPSIRKQRTLKDLNRKNAGYTETDILVGSVGRLVWQKGYDVLAEAVKLLKHEYGHVKFLVAGDGYMKGELMQKINSLGIGSQLILTGLISDIPSFLSLLDYYVQPSLSEGFPLATIEAMAAGLPIVSTNAGGLKFLLEDNVTAVLTEKKDAARLAEAIEKILSADASYINMLKKNALEKSEEFSSEKIAERYGQQYKNILN